MPYTRTLTYMKCYFILIDIAEILRCSSVLFIEKIAFNISRSNFIPGIIQGIKGREGRVQLTSGLQFLLLTVAFPHSPYGGRADVC